MAVALTPRNPFGPGHPRGIPARQDKLNAFGVQGSSLQDGVLRKMHRRNNTTFSFIEDQFKPILKLEEGAFTQDEWVIILQHSVHKAHYSDDGKDL